MQIEIIPVLEEEKTILARLIELYEYDFSEFENSDVNALGLYGYSYLDYYWTEKGRFPYFIKVNSKLAGFVMVCDYCYISKDPDTLFMSEFFVMKKYRKQDIGKFAAKEVFKLHKGKWEMTVHPKNPVAIKFWTNVIEESVGKNYKYHENIEGVYDEALAIAYTFEIV
ncbi:GNAT family N-acetyltransferase [Alkalihalobacterium elongatum]|uniref:GNAT family N-acetyltransferase n=1 Tax=Alkalihalobacterium elongatum TaxID=2675466 RepID=UPI001C1FE5C2|nr:GNAT family N-acetyltransferase [Alkalihalobacterium elongatum]